MDTNGRKKQLCHLSHLSYRSYRCSSIPRVKLFRQRCASQVPCTQGTLSRPWMELPSRWSPGMGTDWAVRFRTWDWRGWIWVDHSTWFLLASWCRIFRSTTRYDCFALWISGSRPSRHLIHLITSCYSRPWGIRLFCEGASSQLATWECWSLSSCWICRSSQQRRLGCADTLQLRSSDLLRAEFACVHEVCPWEATGTASSSLIQAGGGKNPIRAEGFDDIPLMGAVECETGPSNKG